MKTQCKKCESWIIIPDRLVPKDGMLFCGACKGEAERRMARHGACDQIPICIPRGRNQRKLARLMADEDHGVQ